MMTPISADKVLADLIESSIEAKAHYQIWWALAHQARPRLDKQMERFPDFFIATQRAHFDSMIMHLAHLFDKDHATANIKKYISEAPTIRSVDRLLLKKQLALMHPVVKAVLIIRHNVVAHRNAAHAEHQWFKKAGTTPNQVRALINSAVALVETLRRARGCKWGVFDNDRFARDTLGLLEALERTATTPGG
jgi:hypothetical protein